MDKATLESFVAVAELLSFSKAAEKMHITQPAISKRIANLESLLASELFIRQGKDIQLSYSGQVFLQHAQNILQAISDSQIAVHNTKTQVAGTLTVGISHHIGLHRMPNTLKTFSDSFPDVQLQLQFIRSEEAPALILSDELELAIVTLPDTTPERIQIQTLWNDPLQLVVSGSHELAKLQNHQPIHIELLSQHNAILPNFDTYTGKIIQQVFQQQRVGIKHYIETNNLETIRMMTAIGLGWSVLPRSMLNKQLQGLILEGNIRIPNRKLGIMQRESRVISTAAQAFINTLKQEV